MHFTVDATLTQNLVKAVLLMQITKPSSSTSTLSLAQICRAVNFSGLCILWVHMVSNDEGWRREIDHNIGVQNASFS